MRKGQKLESARALRRDSTDVECLIWLMLRNRRMVGAKFRRQLPIGPFVVDFASIEHRLVVEVDGGQHAASVADMKRDRFLDSAGWRVLRFWNNDVTENREGVLERIQETLALTPTLSRRRERKPAAAADPVQLTTVTL